MTQDWEFFFPNFFFSSLPFLLFQILQPKAGSEVFILASRQFTVKLNSPNINPKINFIFE